MEISFGNKNVVVTGGSRGIGRSIALAFAACGANVSICARGADKLRETQRELTEHGHQVHSAPCDLASVGALGSRRPVRNRSYFSFCCCLTLFITLKYYHFRNKIGTITTINVNPIPSGFCSTIFTLLGPIK